MNFVNLFQGDHKKIRVLSEFFRFIELVSLIIIRSLGINLKQYDADSQNFQDFQTQKSGFHI